MLCCTAIQQLVCCCFNRGSASVTDDAKIEDFKTRAVALDNILDAVSGAFPGIATDGAGVILELNRKAIRAFRFDGEPKSLSDLTGESFETSLGKWSPSSDTSTLSFKIKRQ